MSHAMEKTSSFDGRPVQVIGHRGASGVLPEHTLIAYATALAQGADVVEPDLVVSRDGVLFARHEPGLGRSTDVADRPEFADRRRDGDWFCHDFDAVELDRLRAMQPFPGRSRRHDRRYPLPRFRDILCWAGQVADARGQAVILYPEIKHPSALAALGIDPVPLFIDAMRSRPAGVEVWVQCFEAEPLRRIVDAAGLNACLLIDAEADWRAALAEHGDWLFALGIDKTILSRSDGGPGTRPDAPLAAVVAAAHAIGVRVDAWTFRDDAVGAGFASIEEELRAAVASGVDGLFCDFPATAVAVVRS